MISIDLGMNSSEELIAKHKGLKDNPSSSWLNRSFPSVGQKSRQ